MQDRRPTVPSTELKAARELECEDTHTHAEAALFLHIVKHLQFFFPGRDL